MVDTALVSERESFILRTPQVQCPGAGTGGFPGCADGRAWDWDHGTQTNVAPGNRPKAAPGRRATGQIPSETNVSFEVRSFMPHKPRAQPPERRKQ